MRFGRKSECGCGEDRRWPFWKVAAIVLGLATSSISARADEGSSSDARAAAERLFARDLQPLLVAKCGPCHGDQPDDLKGQFDFRTRSAAIRGGESEEPGIVPGNARNSLVYQAVRWDGLEMPPKENDRLTPEQIGWIEQWIKAGAPWPNAERRKMIRSKKRPDSDESAGIQISTSGGLSRDWTERRYQSSDVWAYRPVSRPVIPWNALAPGQPRHPIDAFIQDRLHAQGLEPAAKADRRTLVRRVVYDLTGLPPTADQVEEFTNSPFPDAFEHLVNRLLDSPSYGEQWARHWLDVTRYADTSGFSRDDLRPNAWRYRDYVIRAFRDDKPFNRFILEQLAGDELSPDDPEMLIAVGFLRMGPWEHTGMSVATVTRQQYLDDVTNAVGEVFLGQVLRCAKCHDHKFDPIPTRDYYSLMAALGSTQLAERDAPFLATEHRRGFEQHNRRFEGLIRQTQADIHAIQQKAKRAQIEWLAEHNVQLTAEPKTTGKRFPKGQSLTSDQLQDLPAATVSRLIKQLPESQRPPRQWGLSLQDLGVSKVLNKRLEFLERQLFTCQPHALSVYSGPPHQYQSPKKRVEMPVNLTGAAEVIHVLSGGSIASPLGVVHPGVLSAVSYVSDSSESRPPADLPRSATGRRLALARWIADERNTLTARVIVNRVWQHHFAGKGIVASPNNFGVTGKRPTHPELLDFLAAWFVDHGWSIKKLHRLILSSQTYQQGSRHSDMAKVERLDPDNDLLAYYSPRRLSAEEIRDSMLAVSGEINLEAGGPPIYPEMNQEVALQPIHVMGSVAPAWQPSARAGQRNRRTIYAFRQRNRPDPFLEVFNRPGSGNSCERRDQTTVAPQSLTLLNSTNSRRRSLAMAARICKSAEGASRRIELAFSFCYGRRPKVAELNASLLHYQKMLAFHRKHDPAPERLAATVKRRMVEEMTGEEFSWTETLDLLVDGSYEHDLSALDVPVETRALAELCLVLFNSNEFLYVF